MWSLVSVLSMVDYLRLYLPIFFNLFGIFSYFFYRTYCFLPHGFLLVKLADRRFTCLTNQVKNKHSLTSPLKMTFRDDSHHYLWWFLYFAKIRFTLNIHLFLLSHLLWKFQIAFIMYFMSMSYIKFYGLLQYRRLLRLFYRWLGFLGLPQKRVGWKLEHREDRL